MSGISDLSDFAYKVDAGFEGGLSLSPFGRTYLAVVGSYELCGLDPAEEFFGITADAVVLDLHKLDDALGIADKCATIGHAVLLDHHAERAAQQPGRPAWDTGSS